MESLAGLGLTVFLSFDHARITSQETVLLQGSTKRVIGFHQGSSNGQPYSASLSRDTATAYIGYDIKLSLSMSNNQRLLNVAQVRLAWEEIL